MQHRLGCDNPVLDSPDSTSLEGHNDSPCQDGSHITDGHNHGEPVEDRDDDGDDDEPVEDRDDGDDGEGGDDYEDFEDDGDDQEAVTVPSGFWLRTCTSGLVDPFEPNLIHDALILEACNLGSLIFGSTAWQRLASKAGLSDTCLLSNDPLSLYFRGLETLGLFL